MAVKCLVTIFVSKNTAAENQLITASGVIHNLAFPHYTCPLCVPPQQPQRRPLVGGNPSIPLPREHTWYLGWSWHPCMNYKRASVSGISRVHPPMYTQVPLATCPSGVHSDLLGPSKGQGCRCNLMVGIYSGERLRAQLHGAGRASLLELQQLPKALARASAGLGRGLSRHWDPTPPCSGRPLSPRASHVI